jgi:DNA modification methylase
MTVEIRIGDCRDLLRAMPDASAQCVVTSPPYFGLRDYGVGGQIGLEATPDAFVAQMVDVFREVRRVLKDDGVLFLNLGDSYATGGGKVGNCPGGGVQGEAWKERGVMTPANRMPLPGLKPKDLIGVPWRVAFALQADGWWLRQDIVWSKPNPMPESVRDRCTKAHEYIFLMTKSERYYYDSKAISEPVTLSTVERLSQDVASQAGSTRANGGTRADRPLRALAPASHKGSDFHRGKTAEHQLGRASSKPRTAGNKSHKLVTEYESSDSEQHRTAAGLMKIADVPFETRNKRSVWSIATAPFSEAHFATFPPELPEICIKAGSKPGDTILDPFGGAGTTGLVADRLGRNAILLELNPKYAAIARRRIIGDAPLFAEVSA